MLPSSPPARREYEVIAIDGLRGHGCRWAVSGPDLKYVATFAHDDQESAEKLATFLNTPQSAAARATLRAAKGGR